MTTPHADREPPPAALRAAVRRDLAPVEPLAPPAQRALTLALPALAILALSTLALRSSRADGAPWDLLAGGGVSLVEWLAGLGLLWLAFRDAVPGLGMSRGRNLAALAGGVGVQLVAGIVIWQRSGTGPAASGAVAAGGACAAIVGAIGLPHLALAGWLALAALPMRPHWSGALAGAAAGLLADAVWHLYCSRVDLGHLLVWHLGATVAMSLMGAASGWWWSRLRVAGG